MRTAYYTQMAELNTLLAGLCERSGTAMERSTDALLTANLAVAEQVISDHDHIQRMSGVVEERAFNLLARQAPVAGDLRSIVTTFQVVADIDRMGALALHVAQVARRRHPMHALPPEVEGYFADMGALAVAMAGSASAVLTSQNVDDARRLQVDDDAMDELHEHLFTVLTDRTWHHGIGAGVDVTLLGRYYERFADHAVLIGHRVVFQATGHPPDRTVDSPTHFLSG
ncbi:phosphate signaling complex protein PhoU [Williamsia soli]|uniref:phosphate signaling complex protein PhoU n=1 Tax=Williamsia soli TaxID=364929 RepID=UPI001A9FF52B|nr:phosphate signaling complex protein PhoU [Williamsia soli]